MLPSWTDRLHIFLAPDQVTLSRFGRGLRPHESMRKSLVCAAPADGAPVWGPAIEALRQLLTGTAGRAEVVVYLSSHFARYVLVSPQEGLTGDAEEGAYVRFCFTEIYGEDAEHWSLQWNGALAVEPQVACAIDTPLLAALDQLLNVSGKRLRSVQPHLMAAFNLVRGQLKATNQWYVLVEPGRVCVGAMTSGTWRMLHVARTDAEWGAALPGVLARELRAAGADGQAGDLLLCLPQHLDPRALPLTGWRVRIVTLNTEALLRGKVMPVGTGGGR